VVALCVMPDEARDSIGAEYRRIHFE
jgi:hypothetical protein